MQNTTLARGLGVASLGIGLTELLAPQQVEKMLGIPNGENTGILRALGVREVMHGIDILTHKNPIPGVWARVAGDMLDGVLLAVAGSKTRSPASFALTTAMVMGVVIMDMYVAASSVATHKTTA
jgi:hypothetical protein